MLMGLLGSVFWLVLTLGILVTFHEFGHFWVARRCGVKVEQFSVGFGPALWSRKARDGVEYRIGAIPLGGYVKMKDARNSEVPESERNAAFWEGEFTSRPLRHRLAIVAAGPVFNLIFTVAAFWGMFVLGAQAIAPNVRAAPGSLAAQAGVQSGDQILRVAGTAVGSYDDALQTLAPHLAERQPVTLTVQAPGQTARTLTLPLQKLHADATLMGNLTQIGLQPASPPAVVAQVTPGSPAAQAGLQAGDRIVAIQGEEVANFQALHDRIQALAPMHPDLTLTVQRGTAATVQRLTVHPKSQDGAWAIGVQSMPPAHVVQRLNPLAAVPAALHATWTATAQTGIMLKQLVTGQSSARNVSGVIGIAQAADTSASMGVSSFLQFLALMSLNLAILNLLPIPMLDGGHLAFYLIEGVLGRPLQERWELRAQQVGLVVLLGLMGLAFYNDLHHLLVRLLS